MIFRNANDFCYDNQYLSDYGFIIGEFGSMDMETINQGSDIIMTNISTSNGTRYYKSSASYEGVITSEFRIIKSPDEDNYIITDDEYRDIMRWLNRKEYLQLYFLTDSDEETVPCYYDATFNVSQVYDNLRRLIALDLTMTTNRPFGYGQEMKKVLNFSGEYDVESFMDMSDEIGCIIPNIKIWMKGAGNLTIQNQTMNSSMVIKNCILAETITINGDMKIISTDSAEHQKTIANDFNYEFLMIGNTIDNRYNKLVANLPCEVTITYHPIVK